MKLSYLGCYVTLSDACVLICYEGYHCAYYFDDSPYYFVKIWLRGLNTAPIKWLTLYKNKMTWIQMFEKRFYTFLLNLFFVSMMMNACSVWLNYDNEFDFLWIFSCYSWPLFYFFLFLKDKFCIEYWNVCQGKIEIITHSKLEYSYANWVKHIFYAFFNIAYRVCKHSF